MQVYILRFPRCCDLIYVVYRDENIYPIRPGLVLYRRTHSLIHHYSMVVLCFQGRLTVPIAVTAFVSALGSSFPHGWNTGVLNAPTQVSARRYRCLMGYCLFLSPRLSVKKIMFPVQRVAKIEASRAAAIFLIFPP